MAILLLLVINPFAKTALRVYQSAALIQRLISLFTNGLGKTAHLDSLYPAPY
jgi:hypothetical protein